MTKSPNPFHNLDSPPKVIRPAVMMCVRQACLSFRFAGRLGRTTIRLAAAAPKFRHGSETHASGVPES
jgi:hypothetical protein